MVGLYGPAERTKVGDERVGERLGAAAHDGPGLDVPRDREDEPDCSGERLVEGEDAVRRAPREERLRELAVEAQRGVGGRRQDALCAEPAEREGHGGHAQRRQQVLHEPVRVTQEGADHAPPGRAVSAQPRRGPVEVAEEEGGVSVLHRVRHAHLRGGPLEPVVGERHAAEGGAQDAHRVHRGADVVHEAGLGQLGRAHAAARRLGGLDDAHADAVAGELDGGSEAVGSAANDDDVRHATALPGLTRRCNDE